MLAQGVLDFQYEAESSSDGLTSLSGLPLYLDLINASGLGTAIRRQVRVAGSQGWLDIQMVLAVVFLNLAGGDCVEDIERLEHDSGFSAILRAIERGFAVPCRTAVVEDSVAARTASERRPRLRRCRAGWSGSMIRPRPRRSRERRSFRR